MEYWLPGNWSTSFDYEGLLFFVQKMQEMLYHYSDDIHRAPVHNTSTLANEFCELYKSVKRGQVSNYQLKPLFAELAHSFCNDFILRDCLGDDFIDTVYSQMKGCSDSDYYSIANYVSNIAAPNYFNWTVKYLSKHIPHGNHKTEIEKGARCLISDAIMRGYSGEFIYSYIEQTLISHNVSSLCVLDDFFKRFDFKKRLYKIYMQISEDIAVHAEILHKRLSLNFEDDGHFHLMRQEKRYVMCYFELEALDYYCATNKAYLAINLFLKYYRFISNKRKHMLYKFGAVWNAEDDQVHYLPIIPTGFKAIEENDDSMIIKLLDSILVGVQVHNTTGVSELNKAIELHNSALQQRLPKDGFINLWSVFEVLCPLHNRSTNKDNTISKIDAVIHHVLPVLQSDYFPSTLQSIIKDLQSNLTMQDFNELLDSIEGPDVSHKIAALCLLPEYEKLREELFSKMSNLPLLRYKIYKLYLYRNKKRELFNLSQQYAQRVKWHLYRLYRARNAIVHAGKAPRQIQVLGEHLHSYVDSVMLEVAFKLSSNNMLTNIDSVFTDAFLLLKRKEKLFSENTAVKPDDLLVLLERSLVI